MAIAFVLFSILTGGVSAGMAAIAWDAGLVGTLLAYWVGGMAGAMALITLAALRPEPSAQPARNRSNASHAPI
ncbi:hypothetical protein [Rhodovulum marinum]|uniref:Uncharacterized protein n=1 Tax=Rhodovulum marinum TaxID=320662 RepID=A0A4R2Q1C0_9RHOB|nr:hypothetical protein [Rhodovulum marinum]TCP42412.1 hypothetical protein EV662_103323 [Rhodovulum marinum]